MNELKGVYKNDMEAIQRLCDAIPEGIDNAISLDVLAFYLRVSERELKDLILHARTNQNTFFIGSLPSEQKGYFIPADTGEALRCYRMFEKRRDTTDAILRNMKNHLIRNGVNPDTREEGEPC